MGSIVTEAPGKLVSLWRATATPSLQSVAHIVHGSLRIQNILQSMVPRSYTSSTAAAATEDIVNENENHSNNDDTENMDNSVKCDGKTDNLIVKKVETKKQS